MTSFTFDVDVLILILGALSSLIFSYFPKLNEWFAAKPENYKQFFMLGLMVLITAFVFAGACFAWIPVNDFICGKDSVIHFVWVLIQGIMSNQAIYKVSPQTNRIKSIKVISKAKDDLNNKYLAG